MAKPTILPIIQPKWVVTVISEGSVVSSILCSDAQVATQVYKLLLTQPTTPNRVVKKLKFKGLLCGVTR